MNKHLRYLLLVCLLGSFSTLQAELIEIDNHELASLLEQKTLIVDVRRDDEWRATGTVSGSHLLTFFDRKGAYDAEKWLRDLGQVTDASTPVILICDSGGRSRVIGHWMSTRLGFDRVYNVRDGITRWQQSGRPLQPFAHSE